MLRIFTKKVMNEEAAFTLYTDKINENSAVRGLL